MRHDGDPPRDRPAGAATGRVLTAPWQLHAPPEDVAHPGACHHVLRWSRQYLCRPHAELGRSGPVCPYAPAAMAQGRVFAAVWPGRPTGLAEVVEGMRDYRRWFERSCRDGHHALLVLFPGVPGAEGHRLIERSQRHLKTEFVERGLMVGEFHDGPPRAAALHNPAFRPLHCPVPLLAIRDMVRTDLTFLTHPRHRAAYRTRFAGAGTP
ncbi:DUF6875 domain-containing protein [Actinosynnema sp. NPDC023658]|uniref:DUF6875 domain-containing protein n=1 Tax=Actinosynnema sp. NPDC023658 TaxID=3155465 RepID=UPI00340E2FA9